MPNGVKICPKSNQKSILKASPKKHDKLYPKSSESGTSELVKSAFFIGVLSFFTISPCYQKPLKNPILGSHFGTIFDVKSDKMVSKTDLQNTSKKCFKQVPKTIEKWRPNRVAVDGKFDHGTSKIMPGWPHGLQRPPQGAQGPPQD